MPDTHAFLYLISSVLFIFALRGLSSPKTARSGNYLGIAGMLIAIGTTFYHPGISTKVIITTAVVIGGVIGTYIALRIKMTAMPQLVAAFHSLVGLAAVLIAVCAFISPESYGIGVHGKLRLGNLVEMSLGSAIGAITFTGSIIAFMKLQGLMPGKPFRFKGQNFFNLAIALLAGYSIFCFCLDQSGIALFFAITLALLLGVLLIIPIGGADMPVIVSMLNSYSGFAASGIGFTLSNPSLIITGALVGSSGAILSYIMCKAMNRSILNVVFGGFGNTAIAQEAAEDNLDRSVKTGSAEDAAYLMKNAQSVIIVPGYGMAVAQAQHVLKEMFELLSKEGVNVRFAIHPVAGRMPGHMNVLLAEANISYESVFELEEINRDFAQTDVAIVIGANDVTNPAAKNDPTSPIFGMPILEVENAKTVLFLKRSMASGYAGVENELFYKDNTMMLFGDAKHMIEKIIKALSEV